MLPAARQKRWGYAKNGIFDVAIIGGGVNGACLYHHLCSEGYKVLLVDAKDFACGTSQASGMMIWGGLLYLRNLDLATVYRLSKDRDKMIREMKSWVTPASYRYIPAAMGGRSKHFVHLGLYIYWLLGLLNRKRPLSQDSFDEAAFIKDHRKGSLVYEEAVLNFSDSRFVLHWIIPHQSPINVPLNYCSVEGGRYIRSERLWYLDLRDTLGMHDTTARARWVINCAGVWADTVNEIFNIRSPYRHVFSKGVYTLFKRPVEHKTPLIFEIGEFGDVLTYVPWGSVTMWGPTETPVSDITEGFSVTPGEVRFLLEHANRHLNLNYDKSCIISLRCGIRPLAVKKSFDRDCYPLDISRGSKIVKDAAYPWVTAYGGKITGCISLAKELASQIDKISYGPQKETEKITPEEIETTSFPGIKQRVPSLTWCIRNEFCCTLEDYLRRRTNISQWILREGLGFNNENLPYIGELALTLCDNDGQKAEKVLNDYTVRVRQRFDEVISQT